MCVKEERRRQKGTRSVPAQPLGGGGAARSAGLASDAARCSRFAMAEAAEGGAESGSTHSTTQVAGAVGRAGVSVGVLLQGLLNSRWEVSTVTSVWAPLKGVTGGWYSQHSGGKN